MKFLPIQKKFPPGSFGVCHVSKRVYTVITWIENPVVDEIGKPAGPKAWWKSRTAGTLMLNAVVIDDGRIRERPLLVMNRDMTLAEWEKSASAN